MSYLHKQQEVPGVHPLDLSLSPVACTSDNRSSGACGTKAAPLGCHDCGRPYERGPDLVVSDADWKRIAPQPDGGGILCPNCMNDRFEKIGATAVRAQFTSGPFAVSSHVGREP